jgi:hypothetical protein
MRSLASPLALIVLALAAAVVFHPAFSLLNYEDAERLAAPLVGCLLVAALAARALVERTASAALVALGAAVALAAVGHDAARGQGGRVALRPQAGTRHFQEEGRHGRRLGQRPLGFDLTLERLTPADASLRIGGRLEPRSLRLHPGQSLSAGDVRLSWIGHESRPRLAVGLKSADGRAAEVEVSAGTPAQVGDLRIELERYFAEFALDAANQPYSRSSEPRNPAALLRVSRDGQQRRVFVLRALPGLHNVEGLGLRFSLERVETDESLVLGVHREPAAMAVAAGVGLMAVGLLLGVKP